MIGVRLDGRLGNQMFQYSFAVSLSKRLQTSFYLSQFLIENLLYNYFELPSNNKWINEKIERYFWKALKYYEYQDFDAGNWNEKCIENNCVYQGYMQSLSYFEEYENIILKEFTIKNKWKKRFDEKYASFFKQHKTIVIHVRKGDYVTPFDIGSEIIPDISVSNAYIHSCLSLIPTIENYCILFISDDIAFCKQHFSYLSSVYFEENTEIVDLQLLMNADICILGNSSFSWWGAFLNKKQHIQVFYPKYWMGYQINKWLPDAYICDKLPWIGVHHNE